MLLSDLISLGALLVAVIMMALTGRRDARQGAAQLAAQAAKLDAIQAGVDEIRAEQRALREKIEHLSGAMAAAEAHGRALHHRLDDHLRRDGPYPDSRSAYDRQ